MRKAAPKTRRRVEPKDEERVVYKSSGNVFADLGRSDADELLAKAELARAIRHVITERASTQTAAAKALGITQPDVSNLLRGRLAGFSIERLYRFLNALGQDVRIVVQPKPRSRSRAMIRRTMRAA
jgi:predicted XRE-type DNA-binding protein